MALSFPLSLDAFFGSALIRGATLDLTEATETLTLGGGEVLTAQHGTRLWRGTAEFDVLTHAEHEDAMARVRILQRPGASFLFSPHHAERPGPATAELLAVRNGRELRLSNLPAGMVLARGAFLSWTYGTNPTRHAFHQLAEALTAASSGETGWAEVAPNIRPGFALGATVQVRSARLKAVLIPGTLRPARSRDTIHEGLSFDWSQTLR